MYKTRYSINKKFHNLQNKHYIHRPKTTGLFLTAPLEEEE